MAQTVIHIPPETHSDLKAECQRRGLRMCDVVDELINIWLGKRPAVVDKKPIPPPPAPSITDPYTLPPFWAGR